ncbi:molybdenum ABC transporter ATP-binding protein [Halioxenophilus sp. WMMB6]|uniref:molybdenum ABC transporter ATP-binding protein n=1 Tax=Halioxenophilus sp. WMMB6 TaxID=3073815 RepID=UPI00295E6685|nr:molybdenum ABC transporter ATP-binding protein [Halioxenophilus sp. WMMB6]
MTDLNLAFRLARPGFSLDVSFATSGIGITALFGYSGSGKTTLLRCIAGLEQADYGRLTVNGQVWADDTTFLPSHRRPIGYVFQEANLLQHLTVEGNLNYAIARQRSQNNVIRKQEVVHWLALGPLLKRRSMQLSGGQRQRVAIARALLTNPELLLMDEPLASLDIGSKAEILPYLEKLHSELKIPVLYVSHSPDEVIRLADQIVLLSQGRVLATGPVNEILTRTDLPLAQLEEACACVEGEITKHDREYHLTYVKLKGGTVAISYRAAEPGTRVRVRISAKDVSLALAPQQQTSISNAFPVRISAIAQAADPAKVLVKLDMGGDSFLAQITRLSADTLGLAVDKIVYAQIKSVALMR